jgi:hypothetical protein
MQQWKNDVLWNVRRACQLLETTNALRKCCELVVVQNLQNKTHPVNISVQK